VTGFEPDFGESMSPSWDAAALLAADPPEGLLIETAQLPCLYQRSIHDLCSAVRRVQPDLILCLGQGRSCSGLTIDRIAINVTDAIYPDSAGNQPHDEPVVPGGPAAYFSSLPLRACVTAARAAGVPASIPSGINTVLCNHVFYGLAHLLATELPGVRGGFIHVPVTPGQVAAPDTPSMSTSVVAAGLRAILAAVSDDIAADDTYLTGSRRR